MNRVIFDVVLFISVFTLPWWITAGLAFIGIFVFAQFYEFVVVWLIMYSLYAISGSRIIASPIWFPVIISFTFIGVQILRKYIILYKNEIPY